MRKFFVFTVLLLLIASSIFLYFNFYKSNKIENLQGVPVYPRMKFVMSEKKFHEDKYQIHKYYYIYPRPHKGNYEDLVHYYNQSIDNHIWDIQINIDDLDKRKGTRIEYILYPQKENCLEKVIINITYTDEFFTELGTAFEIIYEIYEKL